MCVANAWAILLCLILSKVWSEALSRAGVDVYIIDSGILPGYIDSENVLLVKDIGFKRIVARRLGPGEYADPASTCSFQLCSHGTQLASLVISQLSHLKKEQKQIRIVDVPVRNLKPRSDNQRQISPDALLLALHTILTRVKNTLTSEEHTSKCKEGAYTKNGDSPNIHTVVLMSMSVKINSVNQRSPILKNLSLLLRQLVMSGAHVVVAAGNSNTDTANVWPAREPDAFVIGGLESDRPHSLSAALSLSAKSIPKRWAGSNYGKNVLFYESARDISICLRGLGTCTTEHGTSYGAAVAAGKIARILLPEDAKISCSSLRQKLIASHCQNLGIGCRIL